MPLHIVRQDITKMEVDAIVNPTNSNFDANGGLDEQIHSCAGAKLYEECKRLGGCPVGEAKITNAYELACKYVIHTVGPSLKNKDCSGEELLRSCYNSSLALAKENMCQSVAFPLISAGLNGYPRAEALRIAVDTISAYLLENDMTVYIVVFDKKSYEISERLFSDIEEFIDDNYVEESLYLHSRDRSQSAEIYLEPKCISLGVDADYSLDESEKIATLEEVVKGIDESFAQMLFRKIDEKGMKDSECYKKANIDRKLFSKIRSDMNYRPSKSTAIALAIALELPLCEVREMLMKAGFALSHSNKFDLIIEYFIQKGNYNIFEINEALFAFDQNLLGA